MKPKLETVFGHKIAKPRPDWGALWVAFVYGIGPVLALGAALDLTAQYAFGVCTGLWCGAR